MPKPGASPTPWATLVNYDTGPRVGTATKVTVPTVTSDNGWLPDQKPPAQVENFWHNEIFNWLEWLNDGTSAADEDAHVVETASVGTLRAARIIATGHTAGGIALDAFGTADVAGRFTGATGINAIRCIAVDASAVEATTTGTPSHAILADASGATFGDGVRGSGGGSGVGLRGTSGAGAGSAGVLGLNSSATGSGVSGISTANDAAGVTGLAHGAGTGVVATGGSGGGTGMVVAAGAGSAAGIIVTATGSASAVVATGGPTGNGISATAGGSTDFGLTAVCAAGATTAAAGVRGQSTSDGAGVLGLVPGGQDGYAVVAQPDITDPNRAALRLVPVTFPVSTEAAMAALDGDVYYNDETEEFRVHQNANWRTMVTLAQGFTFASDFDAAFNIATAGYLATDVSFSLVVPRDGVVWFDIGGLLSMGTSVAIDLRLRDVTNAVTIWEETGLDFRNSGGDHGFIGVKIPHSFVAGTRTITLEARSPAGGGPSGDLTRYGVFALGMLS